MFPSYCEFSKQGPQEIERIENLNFSENYDTISQIGKQEEFLMANR